jgi:hypothetical protein
MINSEKKVENNKMVLACWLAAACWLGGCTKCFSSALYLFNKGQMFQQHFCFQLLLLQQL